MYRISVPVMTTAETFDPEAILADLRAAGAARVFLAIPPISVDEAAQAAVNKKLASAVRFFKDHGIETGVWFWAFWVNGNPDFTPITGVNGSESATEMCPADENFLAFMEKHLAAVAAMGPDLIQFDDDLRFGFLSCGFGCTCKHHRAAMERILGKPLPEGPLYDLLFGGAPNEYRRAFIRANGDSIRQFARRARAAVDSVNPAVRLGQCACLGTFDLDGTDPFEISKLLAGGTRPFVRLIGAPYWAENRNWGNRLQDVIEIERLERAWYEGSDIEIFSEGDAYPRPRFHVPASYLELFDAALRADGSFEGILKYMMDYTSSSRYERGYLIRHMEDEENKRRLQTLFDGKTCVGIRVYDAMKKAEDSDFTAPRRNPTLTEQQFFPKAPRMLAALSFPTVYRGAGCAGIVFGENARHLPSAALEKPLILDIPAARILGEQGIDTGLASFDGLCGTRRVRFAEEAENVNVHTTNDGLCRVTAKDGVCVRGTFSEGGAEHPFLMTYENASGQRFVLLAFDAELVSEDVWRDYTLGVMLHRILTEMGTPVPVQCTGNPDLYVLAKEDASGLAVGFFNCFADYVTHAEVRIPGRWKNPRFFGCTGTLTADGVILDHIPAYGYAYLTLEAEA